MSAELEGAFPNLADGYTVASPKTQAYYPGNQDPHKSLQRIRSSNSQLRLPRDQRSTTESTEIHGKENPNQLPLSGFFCAFRGYAFVMIFLAGVISTIRSSADAWRDRHMVRPLRISDDLAS